MFTKRKLVGGANVRQYKTVIDWEAVGGAIVIGFIVLAVLGAMAG